MDSKQANGYVATPLPESPPTDFFTEAQWDVLLALIDGALPSITAKSTTKDPVGQIPIADDEFKEALEAAAASVSPSVPTDDLLREFLEGRPSQNPRFVDNVKRTIARSPPSGQKKLAGLLDIMATRPGSLLITGYWQPIINQPAAVREAILKSWATARTAVLRSLVKTITAIAQKSNCQTSDLFNQLTGYSDVPRNWKAGPSFDYDFLQFERGEDTHIIETDVIIVGSGCGGGVSAKNLAEAGHRVVVVDKSYHFPSQQFPMPQDVGSSLLFDNNGLYVTNDNGCNVTAGSVWGGGGTVNWSVCLKLQDYVRQEWADQGLPFFTSKEFDESVGRVSDFIGVGTDGIRHNHRNKVMLNGCKKLGWGVHEAPQNTSNKEHYCGQCHLGCGSAEKKGPAVCWLPAAAKSGAQFIEGFTVGKVLFSEDGQKAVGVEGEWVSRDATGGVSGPKGERIQRRVVVKAKKVILSAGSLWSPLLLMKSGLENPHVGSNLHIHPCNFVTAVYKEEVRPWEGGIITSYCPHFENLDQRGHGVKLEPTCMVPYACLSLLPWTGGLDSKLLMLKYSHMEGFISLTRDRDSGKVYPDPVTGRPRISYTVSDYDRNHTFQGVEGLIKLCYVTGATEIQPLFPGLPPFIPSPSQQERMAKAPVVLGETPDPELSDPEFAAWMRLAREVGNKPPFATWASAHQMGTCRMGADAEEGVVDGRGRVWGRENLFVADASVFPSASGVNPMMTVMTIADWVSRGVDEELRASG